LLTKPLFVRSISPNFIGRRPKLPIVPKPEGAEPMKNNSAQKRTSVLVERRGGLIRLLALSPQNEQAHVDPVIRQTVTDVIGRVDREDSTLS
jgi:hypothetical protein